MDTRRLRSAVAAVAVAATMAAAVHFASSGENDIEAVPVVVESAEAQTHPDPPGRSTRDDRRVDLEQTTQTSPSATSPTALPELTFEPAVATPRASSTPSTQAPRTVEKVNVPTGALLSKPVNGRTSSRFGQRFHPILRVWKLHSGLDWAAPCGTPVGAAAAGTVTKVGWAGGNGFQVRIDHGRLAGHRVVTTYNHLSAAGVRVGQEVQTHQGIGRVGSTGYSTGCHLHFEVIADGVFTNPESWLNGERVVVDTTVMETRPAPPQPPATPEPSESPSPSPSPSPTPTPTPSPTPVPSLSPTPTVTPSPTPSPTLSVTPSPTPTPCSTDGVSAEPCPTPTPCPTETDPLEPCPTPTPCPEPSGTATPVPCPTPTPDVTPTPEPCPAPGAPTTPCPTPSVTATPEPTTSPTGSSTATVTASVTPTADPGLTPTPTGTSTTTATATSTATAAAPTTASTSTSATATTPA